MSFAPIPNIDGYSITTFGDIVTFKRYPNGKALSPYFDKDGYLCVKMSINGKSQGFKIHRLVAITFIDNPNYENFVNHKDGNKTNNHISNLEWISNIDNQRHAWQTGLKVSKLTLTQVNEIKELIKTKNNTEIAKIYNVDPSTISNIKTGRTWNKVLTEKQ